MPAKHVYVRTALLSMKILPKLFKKFAEEASKLKVGNGLDEETQVGPIINEKGYDKIVAQIKDAVEKGAEVRAGNQYIADKEDGYFFVYPTVLTNVTEDMVIMQEETFGPVAPIITFKTVEEAVEIANNTPFGLAAYFFTNNYKTGTYYMII